ncbi:membrane protein [Francisella orientalis]|uniref:Outer membrane protein n=1 Tax=Francisella orientalis TaxID=299583 RepID=A0AAP7FUQ1_9GAMM|nr:membrane protein [Francisella orientalis]AHB97865.1 membrane protein [Francisella orientalis LADL 07-285A]AKN84966.1 Outer membrane protein [Francisella orientalis FNO12]AKN86504.1 Outer membrane protein [Francisella orientalis FNO24]AKN88042.1 Outer membrane protein [Francisella orientalis]AKU04797.1 Outer membrane protein [Francisella orientalis]
MKNIFYTLIFLSLLILSGCSTSEPSYSASSIGQVSQVKQGKIIDIQQVHIKGSDNVGARVGGLGGALAGSGNMLTSIAGSIDGAVVGGIAGGATEDAITSSKGYQFTIQLSNGETLVILQEDKHGLNIGDEVTIYMSGNNTRIVPAKN